MKRRAYNEQNFKRQLDIDLERLSRLDPEMSVAELQEISSRCKIYQAFMAKSMLSPRGWCYALGIDIQRHARYESLATKVPNIILNKAKIVAKRTRKTLTGLHNEGL